MVVRPSPCKPESAVPTGSEPPFGHPTISHRASLNDRARSVSTPISYTAAAQVKASVNGARVHHRFSAIWSGQDHRPSLRRSPKLCRSMKYPVSLCSRPSAVTSHSSFSKTSWSSAVTLIPSPCCAARLRLSLKDAPIPPNLSGTKRFRNKKGTLTASGSVSSNRGYSRDDLPLTKKHVGSPTRLCPGDAVAGIRRGREF